MESPPSRIDRNVHCSFHGRSLFYGTMRRRMRKGRDTSSREEMHEIQRHLTWQSAFGRVNIISARHSDVVERKYIYIEPHPGPYRLSEETTRNDVITTETWLCMRYAYAIR